MSLFDEAQSIRFFRRVNASRVSRVIVRFGSVYLIWLLAIVLVVFAKEFSFLLFPAILLPWGVSLLISSWIQRPRPYLAHAFTPIHTPSVATTSFPSEHATVAFALAATISGAGMFFYGALFIASLVAVSRVASGVHYFSDIFVGACIGLSLSLASQMAMALLASMYL